MKKKRSIRKPSKKRLNKTVGIEIGHKRNRIRKNLLIRDTDITKIKHNKTRFFWIISSTGTG